MYLVQIPFRAKSGEVKKGQIINMPEDKAQPLLEAGKITELKACHNCKTYSWWLSIHGVLRCGVCHPPPREGLVKRWIERAGRVAEKPRRQGCWGNADDHERRGQAEP